MQSQDLPMLIQLSSHSEVDTGFRGISHTHCDVYNYEMKSHHIPMMQLPLAVRQHPSPTPPPSLHFDPWFPFTAHQQKQVRPGYPWAGPRYSVLSLVLFKESWETAFQRPVLPTLLPMDPDMYNTINVRCTLLWKITVWKYLSGILLQGK